MPEKKIKKAWLISISIGLFYLISVIISFMVFKK